MYHSAAEAMSWPESVAFLGLLVFVMFLLGPPRRPGSSSARRRSRCSRTRTCGSSYADLNSSRRTPSTLNSGSPPTCPSCGRAPRRSSRSCVRSSEARFSENCTSSSPLDGPRRRESLCSPPRGNRCPSPPAGPPKVELHVINEHPLMIANARSIRLADMLDLSAFGDTTRSSLPDLSITRTRPSGVRRMPRLARSCGSSTSRNGPACHSPPRRGPSPGARGER